MAGRAVDFVRANPDDQAATAPVSTRPAGLNARASQVQQQQRTLQLAVASSVILKVDLRDSLEEGIALARQHFPGSARVLVFPHGGTTYVS